MYQIPDFCLILLYGPSGAGKSTFAQKHFAPTEILSSDHCRAMLCNDPNNQKVTDQAFKLLHSILEQRLKNRCLTVVDATNLEDHARKPILKLAKMFHAPVFAFAFQLPIKLLLRRREERNDRDIPEEAVRAHHQLAQRQEKRLKNEGLYKVHIFRSVKDINAVRFERLNPWEESYPDSGPFDLIGDIHGCYDETVALLAKLDYTISTDFVASHPQGRKLIFLGDLVDRGPNSPDVIRLVRASVAAKTAYCVPGNHDVKLSRALRGADVKIQHGLEESLQQFAEEDPQFSQDYIEFIKSMPSHLVFDHGKLVAVHAGLKRHYMRRQSKKIWAFSLYGEVTGQTDEQGYPIRGNWASKYAGSGLIAYGHTPVAQPLWEGNTLCLDTGCVFGHYLSALRYPEREIVQVKAKKRYFKPGGQFAMDIDTDSQPME